MNKQVHLVGSVPLEDTTDVLTTCCAILGTKLSRVPDGEIGVRSNWIRWQRDILGSHPGIELLGDAKLSQSIRPRYAVKRDFTGDISFSDLGYLNAALESYQVFDQLRAQGKIGDQRFQVSLPTPLAVTASYVDSPSQERIFHPYKSRMIEEVSKIIEAIPDERLAIQWDVATEFAVLEGLFPIWLDDPYDWIVAELVELANIVPKSVEAGYHFCYGDSGNKHFKEPQDTSWLTKLANSVTRNAERSIDWIHMPVPIDRDDADYFRPLGDLDQDNLGILFLGLVHEQDGKEGARRRMAAADAFVTGYGIATECGFGRRSPEVALELLELHAAL